MKILVIGPAYPWRGGIAHHTGLLVNHLRKHHDVEVVTFSRQYPSIFFPGTTQYESGSRDPAFQTNQWIDSINPVNWIRVGLRIRRSSPSLLIFAFSLPFFAPCYGTIAAIARWGTQTRSLFLCHNIVPHEQRFGDRVLTRFAFAFADFFLVQSTAVERDLLALKPHARYRVTPHPLYEMFGSPIDKTKARNLLAISSERVILFFGYIRPYKGLETLLHAMVWFGDVLLLVVGEFYDDEERYRSLMRSLQIEQRVRVVNQYIPNDEVSRYFSAADVVVLPYLSATQSGIVQIAYNFDKPVIATSVGGLQEVVRDGFTGFLVPQNDPEALASAVRRFYNEQREHEFVQHVKQEKELYSWDRMVAVIEELVDGSGTG